MIACDHEQTMEMLRVYEAVEGSGQAYDGDRFIANVDYAIKDVAEMVPFPRAEGHPTGYMPGARNIFGLLRSPQAETLARYVGARLHLCLEDGRRLDFTVVRNLTANSCLVQGLADFRSPS